MTVQELFDAFYCMDECELFVEGQGWLPYCSIQSVIPGEITPARGIVELMFLGVPGRRVISFEHAETHLRRRVVVQADTHVPGMVPERK